MLKVDGLRCVGCSQCIPFCPSNALRVWGVAEVIKESCTDCLECVAYCPVDALVEVMK
ncbi:MAG: 4Fe-4S binding protein [Thermodesulfobacteriota bacterium]|nr:4Fe-4S binding protein [Thermodesulfobacteriota bacterium]